jgi:hypothetical protein
MKSVPPAESRKDEEDLLLLVYRLDFIFPPCLGFRRSSAGGRIEEFRNSSVRKINFVWPAIRHGQTNSTERRCGPRLIIFRAGRLHGRV